MTVADGAAARRNQVPLGIAYMVGSTAMFAGGNAVVKWQLATYPLGCRCQEHQRNGSVLWDRRRAR
jgi:hypothetical protein